MDEWIHAHPNEHLTVDPTPVAPAQVETTSDKTAEQTNSGSKKVVTEDWVMPMEGDIVALADIPDQVFSSGAMGAGFAINPTIDNSGKSQVIAPTSGTVAVVFPTKHAVCLKTDTGDEIIIHVGIDTVALNGEGFETLVKVGDTVTAGTPLLNVDWNTIQAKAPSIITPIIFNSMDKGEQITIENGKPVVSG